MSQAFCPECQRFLPDRYVEGTCPYCGAAASEATSVIFAASAHASELIDPAAASAAAGRSSARRSTSFSS